MIALGRCALFIVALTSSLAFLGGEASAEVPLMSSHDRETEADVVAQVEVLSIVTNKRKINGFLRLQHSIKAKVLSLKKNSTKKNLGQILTARAWTQQWQGQGDPPPYSMGHILKAKAGERYTFYLKTAKDGGLDVLLPNGLEPLSN